MKPMTRRTSERLARQVVHHVERILSDKIIAQGGRLPSERTVALDLDVSRNTVTAAYNDLEQRGVIRRLMGRGAFVCKLPEPGEAFSWRGKVSSQAHLLDEPILELLARNGTNRLPYPFSAGSPSMECFPTDEYHDCLNKVIANQFPAALAVAPTEGQWQLRCSIASWTGIEPKHVMITSGAQEGVDLVARCLIEPGDYAVVESPTYPGAIQCLKAAGARLIGWRTDWSLEKLEDLFIRYRPKLLFTMPSFQNPTGNVMNLDVRNGLLELATRYSVPIVEDDIYSRTHASGNPAPESLLKLDRSSIVIHISTFSKILAPGLRVGWVAAPLYMIKQLSLMKMRANLFTEGLNQLALSEFIENSGLDSHLERLRRHHSQLRNVATSSLQAAVNEGLLTCLPPAGGLYLWCKIERKVDFDRLLFELETKGVGIAPGYAFFAEKSEGDYLRICYTSNAAARVKKGLDILAETLKTHNSNEP